MASVHHFDDYEDTKQWDDDEAEEDSTQDKENGDTSKLLESVWKKSEEASKKKETRTRASTNRKAGPKLTENEMVGPKGLPALRAMFQKHKISDQVGPYENMSRIMKKMEYWAHGLYPPLNFEDFLDKAEHIGRKKLVKVTMSKLRLGVPLNDDEVVATAQPPPEVEDSQLFNDNNEDFERTASSLFDQTFATTTTNINNTTTEADKTMTTPVKQTRAVIDDTQDDFYFDVEEEDNHSVDIELTAPEMGNQQPDRRPLCSRSPSVSPLPDFFKAKLIDEISEFAYSASSDSDDSILPQNEMNFFDSAKKKKVRIVIPDEDEDEVLDEIQEASVLNSVSLKKVLLKDRNDPYYFSED